MRLGFITTVFYFPNRYMKKFLVFLIFLFSLLILFFGKEVFALTIIRFGPPFRTKTLPEFIDALMNFITVISFALVPLMILIGAFYWISSGGEPKKIATGRQIISWAVVGLIIVLLARGIVFMVRNLLGVP